MATDYCGIMVVFLGKVHFSSFEEVFFGVICWSDDLQKTPVEDTKTQNYTQNVEKESQGQELGH